jgi:ABC-2 type transport system permease protein
MNSNKPNQTIQIIAGLKKELLFFFRTFRLLGTFLVFIGAALLYPLLSAMVIMVQDSLETIPIAGVGMGMGEDFDAMLSMFSGESGLYVAYSMSLTMLSAAVIIVMIFLTGTAGAEQKKRSIIMPQTAGLTVSGYVLPKFILYPVMVLVMTVVSAFLSNGVCHLVFSSSYSMEVVLLTSSLCGVMGMFTISLYLFLGISLAQPGMSVIYVLAGNMVFELVITAVFGVLKFTPWNLTGMADFILMQHSPEAFVGQINFITFNSTDIISTITVGLVLCAAFLFVTMFAMTAKRMDNTADEVY